MLNLIVAAVLTVIPTLSAQAQSLPPEPVDHTPPVARCGDIQIRHNERGSLDIWQTFVAPSHVIRVISLAELGKMILDGGVVVQTIEPVLDVTLEAAVDPSTGKTISGRFEVAMHDYAFQKNAQGKWQRVPTRWSTERQQCNDSANELLSEAVAAARRHSSG